MAGRPTRRPTWAGRLPGGLAPAAWRFLHSLPHDAFLFAEDVEGTAAHVEALRAAGVLRGGEAARLRAALRSLKPAFEDSDEDVHSAIERLLTERLGELGAKVHAGRSRNDQVATALRLYARRQCTELLLATCGLIEALAARARETASLLAPGYTHLQRAQPVTVGHWLCAHGWAFARDAERLEAARRAAGVCPLGAGALAGTTLGLDPRVAAAAAGFPRPFDNSIDAVSDRDFLCDAAYACAMATVHLSRLSEELVLWSSAEFGFIRLPDRWATGSSMMPQKKNPDVAELARAQAGPATGTLVGLLVTLKGLPLAYDRDLQADKQNLRGTFAWTASALQAVTGLVANMGFDAEALRRAASDDALCATDLAEAMVARGVAFRRAHQRVASLARAAAEEGISLAEALRRRPRALAPLSLPDALALLDPERSVRRRSTPGGPSPASVRRQAARLAALAARYRRKAGAVGAGP